jgi:hypothetical protein
VARRDFSISKAFKVCRHINPYIRWKAEIFASLQTLHFEIRKSLRATTYISPLAKDCKCPICQFLRFAIGIRFLTKRSKLTLISLLTFDQSKKIKNPLRHNLDITIYYISTQRGAHTWRFARGINFLSKPPNVTQITWRCRIVHEPYLKTLLSRSSCRGPRLLKPASCSERIAIWIKWDIYDVSYMIGSWWSMYK